uniref:adenine phosphoribosyltransferase n=1 Tax=Diplonema papillatum TaxID=91374 RepID=A0A0B6VU03_9EUGL|nr:adenine phosphoribosyltransferase [Diplonema papillatum]
MAGIKFENDGDNHWVPDQEHEDIKTIAESMYWYSPKFSPKDVPKFYDVSGISENPKIFQLVVNLFVQRYKAAPEGTGPTHIIGYDARGFIIGAPIALALGIPFVLLRKEGKNPGVVVNSEGYRKEYDEGKPETLCLRLGSVDKNSRVVLIDDLIATGGTAVAGFELVEALGGKVYEFAACICLPFLDGVKKIRAACDGKFKDVPVFTLVKDTTVPDAACGDPRVWVFVTTFDSVCKRLVVRAGGGLAC